MKIRVLGSFGGESPDCRMTSLLINDVIALDAGSLSQALPLGEQSRVRNIVLSHSHSDHTNSLPFFVENVFGDGNTSIDIHAGPATVYALRKHLFNNATWPDFTRIPNHLLPAVRFKEFSDEKPLVIDGVRFTPIPVNHAVPTHGFLIEDDGAAVLWSSDTGPTDRLWEIANRTRNLRALCVETSFGNDLQGIADLSLHLTPQSLERELEKLQRKVPLLIHHLKPPCVETIHRELGELKELRGLDLDFLEQDQTYEF